MEEIEKVIEQTVIKTVDRLKALGVIKTTDDMILEESSQLLKDFYKRGAKDASVNYALQTVRFDPYFRIILMYYQDGKTLSEIAEALDVDTSTVSRNKKRLCLEIYNALT